MGMRRLVIMASRWVDWGRTHPLDVIAMLQLLLLGGGLVVKEQFLGIAGWLLMGILGGFRWGLKGYASRIIETSKRWVSLTPAQWDWAIRVMIVLPILAGGFSIPFLPYIGVSGFGDTRDLVVVTVGMMVSLYLMAYEWDHYHKWSHPMMAIALYGIATLGWWVVGTDFFIYAMMMVVMGIWGVSWIGPLSSHDQWMVKPLYLTIPMLAIVLCRLGTTHVISELFPTGLMIQYFFSIPGLILGGCLSVFLLMNSFNWWQWVLVPAMPLLLGVVLGPEAGLMSWVSFGYMAPIVGLRDIRILSRLGLLVYVMSVVSVLGFPVAQSWLATLSMDMRVILGIGVMVGWLMVILLSNQIRYEWSLDSVIRARLRRKKRK